MAAATSAIATPQRPSADRRSQLQYEDRRETGLPARESSLEARQGPALGADLQQEYPVLAKNGVTLVATISYLTCFDCRHFAETATFLCASRESPTL
ncbi:hypothetical protein HPB47_026007 [Ixodes persulcatus]|uniref:Uncharacterized protein n=1 Tax=Ixodes persulcatus TaxID=34615 RepID=A0AC60Q1R7_IXOPE|nr:hypothetical protein HPB47_026007 [Ixodes persulcatus]